MNHDMKQLYEKLAEMIEKRSGEKEIQDKLMALCQMEVSLFASTFGDGNVFRHLLVAAVCERQAEMIRARFVDDFPYAGAFIDDIKGNIDVYMLERGAAEDE